MREGYTEIAPGVGVPTSAMRAPAHLEQKHIDGPLLSWAGQLHWLTLSERFTLWCGWRALDEIATKQWPEYRRWHP